MASESEVRQYIGKPVWFAGGVLEIRKKSDATLVAVERGMAVLKHFLGSENRISLDEIRVIRIKE